MKTTSSLALITMILALTPAAMAGPEAPALDAKSVTTLSHDAADISTANNAWKWSTLSASADAIERDIKDGLCTGKMKAIEAIEFRSDLKRVKAHVIALKPKQGDSLGFSQYLILERDINDLRAQVDMVRKTSLKPGQTVEQAKTEFVNALKQALEKKQLAQGDVDKLSLEVKEQDDLYRALKPAKEPILPKDGEVLLNNFAALQVALQQRIKFAREAIIRIDEQRKLIERKLQAAETAGTLSEEKTVQFRSALSRIVSQESAALSRGPLSASQIVVLAMQLDGIGDLISRKGDAISQQTASSKSGVK